MGNLDKLATLGTQDDEKKTNQKHNTICVRHQSAMRKQTQIT